MQQFKPTRSETARVKRFARQCEANAFAAAEFRHHNFIGGAQTCEFMARDYADKALRLAESIATRATTEAR